MSIYQFKPTYLYIKQHSVTGKLYFGKTTKLNPEKYLGSGKHWLRHIKKHGKEYVVTLWFCLFLDQESIKEFALMFSKQQNIVESTDWLNLQYENGLDGGSSGYIFTDEHRAKLIGRIPWCKGTKGIIKPNKTSFIPGHNLGIPKSEETKEKMRKPKSEAHRMNISKNNVNQKGQPRKQLTCPHCGKVGGEGNMQRWHFDNCKSSLL